MGLRGLMGLRASGVVGSGSPCVEIWSFGWLGPDIWLLVCLSFVRLAFVSVAKGTVDAKSRILCGL